MGIKRVTIKTISMEIVYFSHDKCYKNLTFRKIIKMSYKLSIATCIAATLVAENSYKLDKENYQLNKINLLNRFMGTCILDFVY